MAGVAEIWTWLDDRPDHLPACGWPLVSSTVILREANARAGTRDVGALD